MLSLGDRLNAVLRSAVGSSRDKAVLFVLADFIGDNDNAWPSLQTIADCANCSKRSVQTSIDALIEKGVLRVIRRAHASSLYQINYDALRALVPEPRVADPATQSGKPCHPKWQPLPFKVANLATDLPTDPPNELPNEPKGVRPKFDPKAYQLPNGLNTAQARQAWVEWCDHRKTKGCPVTELSAKKLIKPFTHEPPDRFVSAIDKAIAAGWQGFFLERNLIRDPAPQAYTYVPVREGRWD